MKKITATLAALLVSLITFTPAFAANFYGYIDANLSGVGGDITLYGRSTDNIATGNLFQVSATCVVQAAEIYTNLNGGTRTISDPTLWIGSDNAGVPNNTPLERGSIVSPLPTTAGYAWATSTFSGTLTLQTGTNYWLVASSTQEGDPAFYNWNQPASIGGTQKRTKDGTSWTDGGNPTRDADMGIWCSPPGSPTNNPTNLPFYSPFWWW